MGTHEPVGGQVWSGGDVAHAVAAADGAKALAP